MEYMKGMPIVFGNCDARATERESDGLWIITANQIGSGCRVAKHSVVNWQLMEGYFACGWIAVGEMEGRHGPIPRNGQVLAVATAQCEGHGGATIGIASMRKLQCELAVGVYLEVRDNFVHIRVVPGDRAIIGEVLLWRVALPALQPPKHSLKKPFDFDGRYLF